MLRRDRSRPWRVREAQPPTPGIPIHIDRRTRPEAPLQDGERQRVLEQALDRAFERARAIGWIIALVCQESLGRFRELDVNLLLPEQALQMAHLNLDDGLQILAR